jgi:hypothetical protein
MKVVSCPHCGHHRIIASKTPKDLVVVLPCPSCHELVVLFRNKVIPLSRKILQEGSKKERTAHIAEIIAEFLEPGMFGDPDGGDEGGFNPMGFMGHGAHLEGGDDSADADSEPISDEELQRFIQIDLKRIDEASYFRKHFED